MRTLATLALAFAGCLRAADIAPEPGKNFTLTTPASASAPALAMIWIAPGEFLLGSPTDENSRGLDEGPQTRITITRGYWIGRTEVTQAQWNAVMEKNPSRFRGDVLIQAPSDPA